MSRSRKNRPFSGHGGDSEKFDKRKNNRRLRRKSKVALEQDKEILPIMKEVSDPWNMNKDGKSRLNKDSDYYEKEMRK